MLHVSPIQTLAMRLCGYHGGRQHGHHLESACTEETSPRGGGGCWVGSTWKVHFQVLTVRKGGTRRGSYPAFWIMSQGWRASPQNCGVSVFISEVVDALKTLQSKNLRPAIYHANAVLNACSRGKWSHDVIGMSFGNGIGRVKSFLVWYVCPHMSVKLGKDL